MRRIFKQKVKVRRVEPPVDSEFNPARSKIKEEEITKTLTDIEQTLSHLNKRTAW